MTCDRTLDSGLLLREIVGLGEVLAEAGLQTRIDKKFLLNRGDLAVFLDRLGTNFKVLEIAGLRTFNYSSTYFDTADLEQFRAHRQGRRRRYKVRTRTYLDSGQCMFEAKLKGARGETNKHRIPHPPGERARMNEDAEGFLGTLLDEHYGVALPELTPVMTIDYRRGTLVNPASHERVTLDVGLQFYSSTGTVAGPELAVLETKSVDGRGAADQVLAEMGIRAVSMSKYCVGIALLHPALPANRWNRVLRESFGWRREDHSGALAA